MKKMYWIGALSLIIAGIAPAQAMQSVYELSAKEQTRLELWYFGTDLESSQKQASNDVTTEYYENLEDLNFIIDKYFQMVQISKK